MDLTKKNLNEDYLRGISDAAKAIGLKMDKLFAEANNGLKLLNDNLTDHQRDKYEGMTRWTVDESYLQNVAIYAWGYRGQKISLLHLSGLVNSLRDNPESITSDPI